MEFGKALLVLACGLGIVAGADANLITFEDGTDGNVFVGNDYLSSDGVSFVDGKYLYTTGHNVPSGSYDMYCDDDATGTIIMNCSGGLDGLFAAEYSANQTGTITLWSGLNGTGTALDTITTSTTASPFSNTAVWNTASYNLTAHSQVAYSVTFQAAARHIEYDNVSFNRRTVNTPEPFTMSLGLAGVGLFIRRRLKRRA